MHNALVHGFAAIYFAALKNLLKKYTKNKTMNRHNSFNLIHKALRAMLYDAALALQQTYFANTEEAELALEKVEDVLFLFENHAHHEDTFVLPAVKAYEPLLVEEFEKEHEEDLRLSNRLKNLLNIYRNIYFEEEKINCGSAITKSFVEFMVFNLEHMAKEEILINHALWKHYTDEQIIALNQKLVASIPQKELTLACKWMLRGINNFDAISWLESVKKTAPAPAFTALLDLAEKELSEERFKVIHESFKEDAVVA
jgi:hypothetical protein